MNAQAPDLLTYDELAQLSKNPHPGGKLEVKVQKLFTTPFISNEAYDAGEKPKKPATQQLGSFIRVVQWNIEKSLDLDGAIAAFSKPEDFKKLIDTGKHPPGSEAYQEVIHQRQMLEEADIIILQEMDVGVKRSKYKNAPKELAQALGMNYAYGVEQLEIDPMNLGLKEEFQYEDGTFDEEMYKIFKVDPEKYKGLFGSAVLSRYPIKHVEVFQLKSQAYDWYYQEKQKLPFLEHLRRATAKEVFLEKMMREMKIGGRIFFRVDLEVPGLPEDTLSVINIHLEIKCPPKGREQQMMEILSYVHDIKHPVIMAGDFNSAQDDLSPTSVKREIRRAITDPSFLFGQALNILLPQGMIVNLGRFFLGFAKNTQDPTAFDIPIILPNKMKKLFDIIEEFRFADGRAFDHRGDDRRSINAKHEKLANSNQRDAWGFKMTFRVERSLFRVVGKYRLDWIFVKPLELHDPNDRHAPYRFAPHFGITLEEMNSRLKQSISDHSPNVVDIPFEEPRL